MGPKGARLSNSEFSPQELLSFPEKDILWQRYC